MGMAGVLLVDPVVHPDFPVPPGARRSFVDGPLYDIATENLLAPFAVDPRWHELNHAAGLSGEDVGLNRFEPKNFYLLGGALNGPPSTADVQSPRQLFVNVEGSGHPSLLRVLNLNYFPVRMTFTGPDGKRAPIAEVIAHDGQAFRDTSNPDGPSVPVRDAGNPLISDVLAFGAAERYDMLLHPPTPGTYTAHVDFLQWVTLEVLATRSVPVIAR
jgi:hypothetical protein